MGDAPLKIASYSFKSRLFLGTGKYSDLDTARNALRESGTEVVTVAVRRVNLDTKGEPTIFDVLKQDGYTILPNTAGCYTCDDALRTARLARELLDTPLLKLEVIGDQKTLFPDVGETLRAAKILVEEGFVVLPYFNDDPIAAKKLEDLGCPAVMPLAAPIGSGLGIRNPHNIALIVEQARVPVIVDAGVGTASDAAEAMELGVAGVLMNTAIAGAREPVRMARAMKHAVIAGREAFLAGRIAAKHYANASSPCEPFHKSS